MTTLSKDEREIIITATDAEAGWHVFTDSKRAASNRLLKIARAWGIEPEKTGYGYEFTLPLRAVTFRAPRTPKVLSEAERLQRAQTLRRTMSRSDKRAKISPLEGP